MSKRGNNPNCTACWSRECTRNNGLACDDGRQRREANHRQQRPFGIEAEKGVFQRLRVAEQHRALAKIRSGQATGTRSRAMRCGSARVRKFTEIGIEGFRAGHREEDGAQCQEAGHAVLGQEATPDTGLTAARISGRSMMWTSPPSASATNQMAVIGPNHAATSWPSRSSGPRTGRR